MNVPEQPTSLKPGPLRDCLEKLQGEIVGEMNSAQANPCNDGIAEVELKLLKHWIDTLAEAIHFDGAHSPEVRDEV